MTRVMIIDTVGSQLPAEFQARLPGVRFVGHEPAALRDTPVHPHGLFCAWLAAAPCLGAGLETEVFNLRIFDQKARMVEGALDLILGAVAEFKPQYVSRSWGVWDEDNALVESAARGEFAAWLPKWKALQEKIGFLDFGAAGNDDDNDPDADLDYPQVLIADTTHIIGACSWDGVPMRWSGDGRGLACVMVGHQVYSPGADGKWVLWSGTSAATPKACGAAAAEGLTREAYLKALRNLPPNARPVGAWTLPHAKWGWGCDEDRWQRYASRLPAALLPPFARAGKALTAQLEWMEYTAVAREVSDDEAGAAAQEHQLPPQPAAGPADLGKARRGCRGRNARKD